MNLDKISSRLQDPVSTEDQLQALDDLRELLVNAYNLYDKYHNLETDWTKETVSDK